MYVGVYKSRVFFEPTFSDEQPCENLRQKEQRRARKSCKVYSKNLQEIQL